MPRKAGAEWDFVLKLKSLPKGNWTIQCKYCPHTWDGGANRIRAHILGLKGFGVGKCQNAPEDVRESCRKLHCKMSSSGNIMDLQSQGESVGLENVVHGDASQCDEQGLGESSCAHVSKKSKASQGPLGRAWNAQAKSEADYPFWKVRSPYFIDFVQAIGREGPSYKPPSYQQLRSKELHSKVRTIEGDLLQIHDKWKTFGCSILCDGWSDTRNRPIINIMVSCIYASNCIRAGCLVEEQWPHIFFTNATKIVTFITMKPSVLALFRKFSKKDLVKPAPTKFANAFIMLFNLLDERVYNGLRSLMVCPKYMRKRVAKSQKVEEISPIVSSPFFWRNVKEILTDRMIEKISSLDCIDSTRLEEVKNLCIERWDVLHSPLHAGAFVLYAIWREKSPQMDTELCDELDAFQSMSGSFSRLVVKDKDRMHYAVRWWEQFGPCVPNLQKLALYVLSQGSCASPCERNWSTFSLIHTKRRNRLMLKNVEKLVYIHTNLRLISKIEETGFQKLEVTHDMIEKEEDDQRLLFLQEENAGEIVHSYAHTVMESREHSIEDDDDASAHDDDDDVGLSM
ncbi:hypothetical protein KP509_12G026500 [Ceratopteris richardii]|uniref:HAT C-terminal dimerisation domain-containing protein n=1 Tax=Ceratopteris richardii TaxID=49495 RepID=A0A8T2TLX7_CERRI|nr:hypothetical protein KP509_12G026500 [Ceratopteris richardii]